MLGTIYACMCVQIVMDWLAKLLGLPQQFLSRTAEGSFAAGGGVIQGTASEATLVCMLAARARIMQGRPASDMGKLVAYTSDQVTPHLTSPHLPPPHLTCIASSQSMHNTVMMRNGRPSCTLQL